MNLRHKVVNELNDATIYYTWFKWDLPYSVKFKHNSLVAWMATEKQAHNYIQFVTECREDALVRALKGN